VTPSDWDLYGYGTKGYAAIVKAALKAHQAAGMVFDFAGSSNGCVPAEKGNPGLSWELVMLYAPYLSMFGRLISASSLTISLSMVPTTAPYLVGARENSYQWSHML
jgi:hypothetical protein